MKKNLVALTLVFAAAALSRLVPHPWNWTAIGAAALLGGARFEKFGAALLVPLAALFVTDLVIGFHETAAAVYGAFALTAVGARFFRSSIRGWKIVPAAFVSSLIFFLVTNLAFWSLGQFYPLTAAGLVTCFVAALPFWAGQLLGDLFYSAVFFTVWDRAEARFPELSKI